MAKLLYIQASPRGDESYSTAVAKAFLKRYAELHPQDTVETLDLFRADLPEFRAPAAEAKYLVMAGQEPKDEAGRSWKRVIEVIQHFQTADKLVIASPMWNFGIPYRLKLYIDLLVQPGLTFGYSPEKGYQGLVTGRPALLILARGGVYDPGTGGAAIDFQKPYLEWILKFIGFTEVRSILVNPTLNEGPEVARQKAQEASAEAEAVARSF